MLKRFKKKSHQLVINEHAPLELKPKETILNGALRHNIDFPHSCKVGGCGACKCRLIEGKVKELTDKSYLLTREEIENNTILGCQSIPKTDVKIQVSLSDYTRGKLASITQLTHDVFEITVELENPISYRAGQYVVIRTQENLPERCYSFAHADRADTLQTLSFFIRALSGGRMSRWLTHPDNLNKPVEVSHAMGDFYLREDHKPLLMIAGGSGLAPIIALLEKEIATESTTLSRPVTLLFGANRYQDLYYLEQINRLKAQWKNTFQFTPVIAHAPTDQSITCATGLVTDHINSENASNVAAYLCGPPPMIDAAIEKLQRHKVGPEHIFFDKFSDQSTEQATPRTITA